MRTTRRLDRLLVVAAVMVGASLAQAQTPPEPEAPAPATAPTTLAGRITDVLGKPIPGARVYVVARGGANLQTVTDQDGRYSIVLADESATYSVVIAAGRITAHREVPVSEHASTTLDVQVDTDVAGGEVINVTGRTPPTVAPKPTNDNPRKSLPYSRQAVERDAWARAFLLLDIDESGAVARLKLIKRPGFDLDQIAIDEAFKLKFTPARDAKGRPMHAYIVWDMEWPSQGWLVQGNGTAAGRPAEHNEVYREARLDPAAPIQGDLNPTGGDPALTHVNQFQAGLFARPLPITPVMPLSRVPCAGSGPLDLDLQNRAYRDCSRPDLSNVDALPWITRANAKTALATLDAGAPQIVEGPPRSRVPAWIATGVTGVTVAGLVGAYLQYHKYANMKFDQTIGTQELVDARQRAVEQVDRWNHRMLYAAGVVLASGAVTAFMWGRAQTRESFSVQPTVKGKGASVSWTHPF